MCGMEMKDYLVQLKEVQRKLSEREEFEICAEISELITAIETQNVKAFIDLQFDIKGMKKIGFFPKKATYPEMEERIKTFFGYENVFQYAAKEGMWDEYVRYEQGIHDIIPQVIF